jgi:putative transposase
MPKKLNFKLDDEQLTIIEQAIRVEKDARVVRRATGIRLLHLGHRPEEVGEMLMVSTATVYHWHRGWRANGLDGLRDEPRTGRPRTADEDYCRWLEEALESEPARYGYDFAIWTVDRLREHLEHKTGKTLSADRLRVVMQEMGYVYRRPTENLSHAQDQDAHDQAEALIEELKRGPNKAILSSSLWTKRP